MNHDGYRCAGYALVFQIEGTAINKTPAAP